MKISLVKPTLEKIQYKRDLSEKNETKLSREQKLNLNNISNSLKNSYKELAIRKFSSPEQYGGAFTDE